MIWLFIFHILASSIDYDFTAMTKSESSLFIASKKTASVSDIKVKINVFDLKNFNFSEIPTKEFFDRDILALHFDKDKFFALTQKTVGGGDKPSLYEYDKKKQIWIMLGEGNCNAVLSLEFSKNNVILNCERVNSKGNNESYNEEIKLKNKIDLELKKIILPQGELKEPDLHVQFIDQDFSTSLLKIKYSAKTKTINARDLFK